MPLGVRIGYEALSWGRHVNEFTQSWDAVALADHANRFGDQARAYEFYLRTSRLDLDDYNNDTEDGCHITSMAGTWMSVVEGFGGMRVRDGKLSFDPFLPEKWQSFSFNVGFRGAAIKVTVTKDTVKVAHLSGPDMKLVIKGHELELKTGLTNRIQITSVPLELPDDLK